MESYYSNNQFHESFKQGLFAGYIFAATFVIVFYVSYSLPAQLLNIYKRRTKKRGSNHVTHKPKLPLHDQEFKHQEIKQNRKKATQSDKLLPVELLDKRVQINKVWQMTCRMSFKRIYNATENFSNESMIGVGMTGVMYKAKLPNHLFLAVKRLYDSQLCIRNFEMEIMILGRFNHRNIIPLIGFCIEEQRNERILVYEYMSNGRLSDWLNLNDTTKRLLEWNLVIRIALGVARGLCSLHHSLNMVHHRISSECILLGYKFEPKISNFGFAKFMKCDLGNNNNRGFEKKDVYDFGTLLFEMIKGKKLGQIGDCFRDVKGPFSTYTYPNPINMMEDPFGFYDAVDKCLKDIEFEDEVSALLRVACDCVHPVPYQRPTMLQVYSKMSNIWDRDGVCDDSF